MTAGQIKSLKIAIQMDPMEPMDINADSTFDMALEAKKRGHQLFHYLFTDLVYEDGEVRASMRPLDVRRVEGDHYTLGEPQDTNLKDIDVVLMRQDPPFDMAYITATHLLDMVHPETFVVNDPTHVRNCPEKLFVTDFVDLMPPTMIAHSKAQIEAFREKHKDIIIKPLYGNGGAGVFRLQPGDQNISSLLEMFQGVNREPLMIQAYLPDVRAGDKRIILVDGEPVGALNRIPPEGEARSNMHVGGKPAPIELTDRDKEICARIGPALKERGMIFVGIDVIGDYMTEINVTSPTGIQEINRFNGTDLSVLIWDAIESKIS
jgi:glutathione synthase